MKPLHVHILNTTSLPKVKDRRWIADAILVSSFAVLIWGVLAMFGDM